MKLFSPTTSTVEPSQRPHNTNGSENVNGFDNKANRLDRQPDKKVAAAKEISRIKCRLQRPQTHRDDLAPPVQG